MARTTVLAESGGSNVTIAPRLRGKLTSEVLFCFPGLRFDVFSPYRDGRYRSAPKPGKEKQKSYDYRSAILIVHGFRSFLSVFTQVLRKIRRKVTRKLAAQFRTLPPLPRLERTWEALELRKARISDIHGLPLRARLGEI